MCRPSFEATSTSPSGPPLDRSTSPDRQRQQSLADHRVEIAITPVSVAELLYGVQRLAAGRGRTRPGDAVDRLVAGADASGRILDFGQAAAREYASIRVDREAAGRPVTVEDAMIAAVARAAGAAIATRNVRDYADTGVAVIDPWLHA